MSLFNLANTQLVDAPNQKLLTPAEFAQQFPSLVPDDDGGMKVNTDIPSYESYFNSLPDSIKQTPAYINQKAELATGTLFNDFATNGRTSALTPNLPQQVNDSKAFLESIKESDPLAYWNAQLSLNLQKAGWDAGQGKVNQETNAKIQDALQNAQAIGLPQEQINNLIKINYEGMAKSHADNISQRQGQGATLQGIEKVAPAFAAMITAGALAPAAGALEAGSVAGETALGTAGADSIDAYMTGAGLDAGSFGGAGDVFAGYSPTGSLASTAGDTALESNVALSGANAESIPFELPDGTMGSIENGNILDASGNVVAKGGVDISAADVLKYANTAKQALGIGSTLAKLVAGGAGAGATGGTSAGTQKALANLLSPSTTGPTNFTAIKMNQNPFLQTQQPTTVQTPFKQHDFLAELSQEGKTQPTMADLLRNA